MTIDSVLGRLRTRVQGIDLAPRERMLVLALLVMACLVWAMAGLDAAQSARSAAEDARRQLVTEKGRQASLASESFRTKIRDEAEKARVWSLEEPTVFMAQMRAQSVLEDYAIAAGIADHEIIVDRPDPSAAGVQRLSMTVEGDFSWPTFLSLLSFLEASETSIVPAAVEVSASNARPRFSMTLEMAYLPPRRS